MAPELASGVGDGDKEGRSRDGRELHGIDAGKMSATRPAPATVCRKMPKPVERWALALPRPLRRPAAPGGPTPPVA